MSSLSILFRSVFFSTLAAIIAAVVVVALAAFPARGAVVFVASGTSAAGRPVEFKATLSIVGIHWPGSIAVAIPRKARSTR